MMEGPNNGLILYHYSFSPYARRIVWYLALRGIDYAECSQPPMMPRPDVKMLGINYRRIPIMAIGKDVYCDTRIILKTLEKLYPDGKLGASDADQQALQKLLEIWSVEGGLFTRASQLIPSSAPIVQDPKFQKDREDFSGRPWTATAIDAMRPEALANIRNGFAFLESTLLADGRSWILKTDQPSLADIEAIWVFDWLNGLKDALPRESVSAQQYPKVFAWITRFNEQVKTAKGKMPKPTKLRGDMAAERIKSATYIDTELKVNEKDPAGFCSGDEVQVWPIDSGFNHRDRGRLLGFTDEEIVLEIESGGIRTHYPRVGFRIKAARAEKL